MKDEAIRNQLVLYARKAYTRQLVGGTGGNFSARLQHDRMAITPSGISLGDTTLENLITVDLATYEWEPRGEFIPSKEYHFHADILRLRPDIGAVLHAHSPYATAYAVKKRDIPMVTDAAFKQPPIPHVPFAPSGSRDLQENVVKAVSENPHCKALLMEQHGIAALGKDVVAAFDIADLTEELARIAFIADMLR